MDLRIQAKAVGAVAVTLACILITSGVFALWSYGQSPSRQPISHPDQRWATESATLAVRSLLGDSDVHFSGIRAEERTPGLWTVEGHVRKWFWSHNWAVEVTIEPGDRSVQTAWLDGKMEFNRARGDK